MFLATMFRILAAICCFSALSALSKALGPDMTSTVEAGAVQKHGSSRERSVCQEFRAEDTTGSGWLLEDCIDVWKSWAPTVSLKPMLKANNRQFFLDVSDRLRRQGTPCHLGPPWSWDGAGSRTMRYLATLILAEELGCDSLLPKGYQSEPSADGTLYCHQSKTIEEKDYRCSSVDWIEFFNMSAHMKPFPDDGQPTNTIDVRRGVPELRNATDYFLQHGGFEQPPWIHWILNPVDQRLAGTYVARPDTWNAARLEMVRDILERMKRSFWWRSRPGDGQVVEDCSFESSRANIAIHVRLGDRDSQTFDRRQRGAHPNHDDYFDKLEDFMDTVSAAALRQGEASPVFHIFSETYAPCPSDETGAFQEFPRWRVETDQITPCMDAVTPDDCWEKTQGAPSCPSPQSGVFLVQGKPVYLHVGLDVENAMSCMIEADGIMMGCSTFGQAAGLFSAGVRFFSVGCEGWATVAHYQMVPPMAIAERGNMWVPVSGSWRDPVIFSERILDAALSQLYEKSERLQVEVEQP